MKKILKMNFIVTTLLLCTSFLLCGIVEINDRTSYVISGQKSEVFRSQKIDGGELIALEKSDNKTNSDEIFLKVDLSAVSKVAEIAKYCSVPPIGCIVSFFEENSKENR